MKGSNTRALATFAASLFFLALSTDPSFSVQGKERAGSGFQMLFDEVCRHLEEGFIFPDRARALLREKGSLFREKAGKAENLEGFAAVANEFLEMLHTSHTVFLPRGSQEFYQYVSVFGNLPPIRALFPRGGARYPSIGVYTRLIEGKRFVVWLLDGGPAAKAGARRGDEIIDADGKPFHPIRSFSGKAGKPVSLCVRRHREGKPLALRVVPVSVQPHQEFLDAETASVRVFRLLGRKIGYIHIWSYAGEDFHQAFLDEISGGKLAEADSLILDLRDGLGGANPSYLNVFNRNVPVIEFADKSGKAVRFDTQWRKPVVLLVNGGSRSGKEVFAFGFKKFRLGTIIGERTSGAVLGGRIIPLSDGSLFFMAATGGTVDGVDLEGVGVQPDIEVPMPIQYLDGKDIQLVKAIENLLGKKLPASSNPGGEESP